jgi:hypothetical protein
MSVAICTALPSPEHELTDPMRGVTARIPGAHPTGPKTPGEQRVSAIPSFWAGTTDVEYASRRLETIEDASPAGGAAAAASAPPEDGNGNGSEKDGERGAGSGRAAPLPPATAPVARGPGSESAAPEDDYFGPTPPSSFASSSSSGSAGHPARPSFIAARRDSEPPLDVGVTSVPAVQRRVALTRQTSSPLPTLAGEEGLYIPGIPQSTGGAREAAAREGNRRAVKEKQMFEELGYLVPPNTPDELDRRRALYK